MTRRETIAEGEARSRTEQMCGNFSYGYDEGTVEAMLDVIADYARAGGMSSEQLRAAYRAAGTHFSSAPAEHEARSEATRAVVVAAGAWRDCTSKGLGSHAEMDMQAAVDHLRSLGAAETERSTNAPGPARRPTRPIRIGGREYAVLAGNPDDKRDLLTLEHHGDGGASLQFWSWSTNIETPRWTQASGPIDLSAVAVHALAQEIADHRAQLRPEASRVAGALLRLASDTFVNHGCNDFDLAAVVPDVSERRVIMRAVEAWYGNHDPDPADEYRVAHDWRLMRFLGEWLRGAPIERLGPARKPPSSTTEVTLPRHRFLGILDEMFHGGAHFGREHPQHGVAGSGRAADARVAEVMAALDAESGVTAADVARHNERLLRNELGDLAASVDRADRARERAQVAGAPHSVASDVGAATAGVPDRVAFVMARDSVNGPLLASSAPLPHAGGPFVASSEGDLPMGLDGAREARRATHYWIIVRGSYPGGCYFQLAASREDALAQRPVDLTAPGSGMHFLRSAGSPETGPQDARRHAEIRAAVLYGCRFVVGRATVDHTGTNPCVSVPSDDDCEDLATGYASRKAGMPAPDLDLERHLRDTEETLRVTRAASVERGAALDRAHRRILALEAREVRLRAILAADLGLDDAEQRRDRNKMTGVPGSEPTGSQPPASVAPATLAEIGAIERDHDGLVWIDREPGVTLVFTSIMSRSKITVEFFEVGGVAPPADRLRAAATGLVTLRRELEVFAWGGS